MNEEKAPPDNSKEVYQQRLRDLEERLAKVALQSRQILNTEFDELLSLVYRPWRLIWNSFLLGLARGIGMTLGMTFLGTVVIGILIFLIHRMVDLPLVGNFVAQLITVVKSQLPSSLK